MNYESMMLRKELLRKSKQLELFEKIVRNLTVQVKVQRTIIGIYEGILKENDLSHLICEKVIPRASLISKIKRMFSGKK